MKIAAVTSLAAMAGALLAVAPPARAATFTYTTLEVPGAVSTQTSGLPDALNDSDQVVGTTRLPGSAPEGFLWQAGAFTLFSQVSGLAVINNAGLAVGLPPSGAGYVSIATATGTTQVYADGFRGTLAAVNRAGAVAAQQQKGVVGYLLKKTRKTPLSVPNAMTTTPTGVNDGGTVTGAYTTGAGGGGFTYAGGTYTTFAPADAANVNPLFIMNDGTIGGSYTSYSEDTLVGFVFRGGNFYLYAPANAAASSVSGIGPGAEVVGSWEDPQGGLHQRGFIFVDDAYYTINYPGAADTAINGVNANGTLIGTWYDAKFRAHPFVATCPPGQTCTR
jgi:hypothetical protein